MVAAVAWGIVEVEKRLIDDAVVDALVVAMILGVVLRNVLTLPSSVDDGANVRLVAPSTDTSSRTPHVLSGRALGSPSTS